MKTLCTIAIVSSAVLLGAEGRPQVMIAWAYAGSEQSQMFSVDAVTGQLVTSFGQNGYVMLGSVTRPDRVPCQRESDDGSRRLTNDLD